MIDVKLGEGGDSIAFLTRTDLMNGKEIIYLGGNMKNLDVTLRMGERIGYVPEIAESPSPSTILYEERMEHIITHESAHIAIFKATNSVKATMMLDNIDKPSKPVLIVDIEESKVK